MLNFLSIISIFEVLLVIFPALLTVAFVTIAERKTMASMQRRLGPNIVGYWGLLQALIGLKPKYKVRNSHTNPVIVSSNKVKCNSLINHVCNNSLLSKSNNNNCSFGIKTIFGILPVRVYSTKSSPQFIKELYKDRLAPVKPFSDKILVSCPNILDLSQRAAFFSQLKGKGGIYIFQYKHDPLVYYIGRTSQFTQRFKSHITHKLSDKFHVFGKLVGWDNFTVSVIEICDRKDIGVRENYYLQKYLPLLNSNFLSNFSETFIYQSLTSILKSKKSLALVDQGTSGTSISIWVYNLLNTQIDPTPVNYSSIAKASSGTGIGRPTISLYLDSHVSIKGLLFFSKPIKDLDSSFEQAKKASEEFNLDFTLPKKVWVYTVSNNKVVLVNNQPFYSRGLAARFLDTTHNVVRYHMDCWKGKGFKGYYLFSKPLADRELESLLELSLSSVDAPNKKVEVWAYCAQTLELINNSYFTSMQKAADYFKVMYTTIGKHLDTELATKQGGKWVYFFSKEISTELKDKLKNEIKKASNASTEVWVYKKLNGQYYLLDNNQPFNSKQQAYNTLKLSPKTINKLLDTHICHKELYFFSEKL